MFVQKLIYNLSYSSQNTGLREVETRPARPQPRPIQRKPSAPTSALDIATSLAPAREASQEMELQPLPRAPHALKRSRKRGENASENTTSLLPPPKASAPELRNSRPTSPEPGPSKRIRQLTGKVLDVEEPPTTQPEQPVKRTRKLTEKAQALQATRYVLRYLFSDAFWSSSVAVL